MCKGVIHFLGFFALFCIGEKISHQQHKGLTMIHRYRQALTKEMSRLNYQLIAYLVFFQTDHLDQILSFFNLKQKVYWYRYVTDNRRVCN